VLALTYTLDEARREALRQSERHLEAQHALAIAADQRALAFCAALIVIVALLVESMDTQSSSTIDSVLIGIFIVSAVVAGYAAKPTRFYGSGGSFAGFAPYLNETYCDKLMDALGDRNDEYIRCNDRAIKFSAAFLRGALILALVGLVMMFLRFSGALSSTDVGVPRGVGEPAPAQAMPFVSVPCCPAHTTNTALPIVPALSESKA
jgi:hypothetical protein